MLYPYAKIIHEEVVDGGWKFLFVDQVIFFLKCFVFIFTFFLVSFVWYDFMVSVVGDKCVESFRDTIKNGN